MDGPSVKMASVVQLGEQAPLDPVALFHAVLWCMMFLWAISHYMNSRKDGSNVR
jgi:hypothetical protein